MVNRKPKVGEDITVRLARLLHQYFDMRLGIIFIVVLKRSKQVKSTIKHHYCSVYLFFSMLVHELFNPTIIRHRNLHLQMETQGHKLY